MAYLVHVAVDTYLQNTNQMPLLLLWISYSDGPSSRISLYTPGALSVVSVSFLLLNLVYPWPDLSFYVKDICISRTV